MFQIVSDGCPSRKLNIQPFNETDSDSFNLLLLSSSQATKQSSHPTEGSRLIKLEKKNKLYLQFSLNELLRDLFGLKLCKTLLLTSPFQKSTQIFQSGL